MSVHIRIVTPVVPTGLTSQSDFDGILSSEDRLDFVELSAGPDSIESAFDAVHAAPGTVARVIEAEAEGADAVVLDCMEDPGLAAAREAVSIPVLGPGQTTMALAAMLGHRYSILSVNALHRSHFEAAARLHGLDGKYASTRSVGIPVAELSDAPRLKAALFGAACTALEQDDADTLILGCTGMLGAADALRADLLAMGWDVPVLDPIPVTVRVARALAISGLAQSKRAYPLPGGAARKELRKRQLQPSSQRDVP